MPAYDVSGFRVLAQLTEMEVGSGILRPIDSLSLLNAAVSVGVAYALSTGVQLAANWLSEEVPKRFRLTIKQSIPFWKGIILIGLIAHLVNLFLDLSQQNLLALTGTLAVALGFAFKDYATSIIAGVVALFEGPYRVGDRVTLAGHSGEIVSYGLRGIRLRTFDDTIITIPHSKTWSEAVINLNRGNLEAQVVTDFYVDHRADSQTIMNVLSQAAYSSRFTQLKLPVVVGMTEQPWGTHFTLRAYPMDIRNEPAFRSDLIRRAKDAFAELGIPYPNKVEDT